MNSFPLATAQIQDEGVARSLIQLLDATVTQLAALEPEPTLVAEAPNKFNDASHDDFWYAVQSGRTFWEQSQFFEYERVDERSSFVPEQDVAELQSIGGALQSQRIAELRRVLRGLQASAWRSAVAAAFQPPRNLVALVLEFGRPWLYLEQVNGGDGDAFAWDKDGFFHVGTMSRLDQAVDQSRLLQFENVDPQHLDRLGERARTYFLPQLQDLAAADKLVAMLHASIAIVRAATDVPVALRSRGSRNGPGDRNRFTWPNQPEAFAANLRPSEGEYRVPTNGKWPMYRSPRAPIREESEMSDVAKAYSTAMFQLENGKWRDEFSRAFGQKMGDGETLALFVNKTDAIVMRDNTAFSVRSDRLQLLGVRSYPDCRKPELVVEGGASK